MVITTSLHQMPLFCRWFAGHGVIEKTGFTQQFSATVVDDQENDETPQLVFESIGIDI
jgi:uncharacterized protein YodC (DUF2158 family)